MNRVIVVACLLASLAVCKHGACEESPDVRQKEVQSFFNRYAELVRTGEHEKALDMRSADYYQIVHGKDGKAHRIVKTREEYLRVIREIHRSYHTFEHKEYTITVKSLTSRDGVILVTTDDVSVLVLNGKRRLHTASITRQLRHEDGEWKLLCEEYDEGE